MTVHDGWYLRIHMSRGSAGKNEAKLRFDVALTMLCVNDPDFPNACGSAAKKI